MLYFGHYKHKRTIITFNTFQSFLTFYRINLYKYINKLKQNF